MYRFCECKYSFKLALLWRKLEFYIRNHKKVYLLLLFNYKIQDTYDHIAVVLALRAQHRTLLFIFFTKQYFLLNSNPALIRKVSTLKHWLALKKFENSFNWYLNDTDHISLFRVYQWGSVKYWLGISLHTICFDNAVSKYLILKRITCIHWLFWAIY